MISIKFIVCDITQFKTLDICYKHNNSCTKSDTYSFIVTTNLKKSGAINFLDDKKRVLFHFNPRPSKVKENNVEVIGGIIVMNTWNRFWGVEERIKLPTSQPSEPLLFRLFVDFESIAVYLHQTDVLLHTYKHRLPWSTLKSTKIDHGW